jgi:hypothetical protein
MSDVGALLSMREMMNELYADRGGIQNFTTSLVFFMRVGGLGDPYVVQVTMKRVSPLRVKIDVEPCWHTPKESEIKCLLSVNELGIPVDLPIQKINEEMLVKIAKYENMKGEEQRRIYRKKFSTFIRKCSKLELEYISESLNYVHTEIYQIQNRGLTKVVDVGW